LPVHIKSKIKNIIILFLFIFSMSAGVFAQNTQAPAQELRIGSFISSNLAAGQEAWYSVRASDNGILTVETISNIDTCLEAYDAQRNFISLNDDGGAGSNAKIDLIASAGETYLFKLKGYGSGTWGAYQILADMKNYPETAELQAGASFSGNLEPGQEAWFYFKASETGILSVDTLSDTGAYIEVYNEYLVPQNDFNYYGDALFNRADFEIKPGMILYFNVKSFNNGASDGDITEKISYQISAAMTYYPAPLILAAGSFLNGHINPGDEYWYSVRAARDGYLIVETAGTTDTFLDVYDQNYNWIDNSDDGPDHYNARIRIFAQAGQTYLFRLKGYGGRTSGPYRIFAGHE